MHPQTPWDPLIPVDSPSIKRSTQPQVRSLLVIALLFVLASARAFADISNVVFSDDFSSNTIDPGKYVPDAPFFEGGTGDIHAEAADGVIRFVGQTTQQWWSGGTLRVVPTFSATEQANAVISIDRVSEVGVGSASRSALWILDETRTSYVLFADVRGEGGWRYNRKIGEDGDVPTGSGVDIGAFNGGTFDDGGLHRMKIVANGKTVKLYLDGQLGTEVKFPFSKVVCEFGSYARANNDTAATTWDNLKIENTLQTSVVFSDDFSANSIDAGKYAPDAPFFEGGTGDIHPEAANGVIQFVGHTTQQWWSGGTLRVVPTFTATEDTVVAASIDRISEVGVGSASRSAFWILDTTGKNYVLFADVRGEGGWRYNRKIGEDGDVPTGSGVDIGLFNGGAFDNGGQHRMQIVANGKTVKLLLDGDVGAEVKFPFSKVMFEFGSYARANNDTADTTFDNFLVETTVPQTTTVFADDFSSNAIDPAKYQPDAPFFEGGTGDIHAEAADGTIHFLGTTTQQWWSGGTLRVVPTFTASDESTITLTIDRVAEIGKGSASRSALWILDQTRTKYVLFADVRGEGGWRFNRKIDEDGDVPTGSGTDIGTFNGGSFDDGGLHHMKMVADGKTVKLFLDDQFGTEVKFPFNNVVFEFGSYARANNDTGDTTFDNLKITATGASTFSPTVLSLRPGQLSGDLTLRIPPGLNAQSAVTVRVVSSDPTIAVPEGGTGDTLNVTFPAGGANTRSFKARGVALGGVKFTAEGAVPGGNTLTVVVSGGPGTLLADDFSGASVDPAKWLVSGRGFEGGTGTFDVNTSSGALQISGTVDVSYWPGASIISAKAFTATRDLHLVVDVDRVMLDPGSSSAARSGIYLTSADHKQYFFLSHDMKENGWSYNLAPGAGATGGGARMTQFNTIDDGDAHHIQLVYDGEAVDIDIDGVKGPRVAFAMNVGIFVELGGYARAALDTVTTAFDNVLVQNAVPCTTFDPAEGVSLTISDAAKPVAITVPKLLNDSTPATVTVTSRDKSIAVPNGSANGTITLTFAAGSANTQTFTVTPVGTGSTLFDIVTAPASCVAGPLAVEVLAIPQLIVSDSFTGDAYDTGVWVQSAPASTGIGSGIPTDESTITVVDGQIKFDVTRKSGAWAGLGLETVNSYSAGLTTPLTFEIDRTLLDFVLVTGTGAKQRTGIWVKDPNGNFVLFSDFEAHDGGNFGWRYNMVTGAPEDDPAGNGINILAFDGKGYDNSGNHRMKMVVNGATVRLYLDGTFGAEVPFPYSDGLTFAFGAYVLAGADVVRGNFDNAVITGGSGSILRASVDNGIITISWLGGGVLQFTDSLSAPDWKNVTPAPAGNSISVAVSKTGNRFYRLQ